MTDPANDTLKDSLIIELNKEEREGEREKEMDGERVYISHRGSNKKEGKRIC